MNNKSYADAAGAYGKNAHNLSRDQREVEARVLVKSADALEDIKTNWSDDGKWQGLDKKEILSDCLLYNRSIWLLFYDAAIEKQEAIEHQDTQDKQAKTLRSNIINLANFIFKREMDILRTQDVSMLESIITINREISAGLMVRPNKPKAGALKP
ncbi:MAG: flagellar biosynthesis regulator FlaF [Pseudomonadota bacterium]|jgi:flagellar protein FlaF|nr:flagellar FlaF family protein [Alphaproteobacteria bacterium]MEC7702139.1 flagellar biosynthesis regulator FlaF [Pseudomonadota bacterium]MCS5597676.1 flagellar biosynthesis regulator FlaF [Alphaproteobacteria bacterium]MEC9236037.1 flagellar biosynthesis regulator FlaF [Pseudomonadota bacterium]MED5421866.1 flagellar biosynthesis regulator FlaF [Pseudomonadota bacterium]|tara:strand:- start:5078 stop:5542 length:465 start_codon:yes stop_codon:yes gene_type:complete